MKAKIDYNRYFSDSLLFLGIGIASLLLSPFIITFGVIEVVYHGVKFLIDLAKGTVKRV